MVTVDTSHYMSRAADALRLSGLAELSLAVIYGNYQEALRSPMTLGGFVASPDWMVATHVHLIGLHIITILFSFTLDDAFHEYRDLTAGIATVAVWFERFAITIGCAAPGVSESLGCSGKSRQDLTSSSFCLPRTLSPHRLGHRRIITRLKSN